MMTPDEDSSGCFLLKTKSSKLCHQAGGFVKIILISDIHANYAALNALKEEGWDALWCLGDLVDYGPRPKEVVDWVRRNATICVRGNHDHAVGFNVDPQCSVPFQKIAASTRRYTQQILDRDRVDYLRNLPVQQQVDSNGARFYLVHAKPTDPLFGYLPSESPSWEQEASWINSDVLIVGHTHTPFIRQVGRTTVINPGSIGQPKTGRSLACYAIWEDGKAELKEYDYPIAETARDIRSMPIPTEDQNALISALKTGIPSFESDDSDRSANEIYVGGERA
jgi:putative phosphoesterase